MKGWGKAKRSSSWAQKLSLGKARKLSLGKAHGKGVMMEYLKAIESSLNIVSWNLETSKIIT